MFNAVDVDIALLNVNKNNNLIKTNHRNMKKPNKSFYQYKKKTRINQLKTFKVIIIQENHSQITRIPLENNHLTEISTAGDLQIEETHKFPVKIDIVDQTVKTNNIETIIQDQTQTEVTIQVIRGIFHIQTLEIDIIQKTVPEIPRITKAETTQTVGREKT